MMMKKSFAFLLLSLMLFGFVVNLVSAQTIVSDFAETVNDYLRPWEAGENLNLVFLKYLVLILVWMVVWSVLHHIPGLNGLFDKNSGGRPFLGAIFSFIIAFLAMAYITPPQLEAIMASYSGLGFTIGALLPLIIIMAWTFDISSSSASQTDARKKVSSNILAAAIWLLFGVFTLYKLSRVLFTGEASTNYFIIGSVGVVLLCAIMVFGGVRWVNHKMSKLLTKEQFSNYRHNVKVRKELMRGSREEVEGSAERTTKDEF